MSRIVDLFNEIFNKIRTSKRLRVGCLALSTCSISGFLVYYVFFRINISFYTHVTTILSIAATASATIIAFALSATLIASQASQSYSLRHAPLIIPRIPTFFYALLLIAGVIIPVIILSDSAIGYPLKKVLIKCSIIIVSLNTLLLPLYLYRFRQWLEPCNVINRLYERSKVQIKSSPIESSLQGEALSDLPVTDLPEYLSKQSEHPPKGRLPKEIFIIREVVLRAAELHNYQALNRGLNKLKDLLHYVFSPKCNLSQKKERDIVYAVERYCRGIRTALGKNTIALEFLLKRTLDLWQKTIEVWGTGSSVLKLWNENVKNTVKVVTDLGEEDVIKHYQYLIYDFSLATVENRNPIFLRRLAEHLMTIHVKANENNWDLVLSQAAHQFGGILRKVTSIPWKGDTEAKFNNTCNKVVRHLGASALRFYKKHRPDLAKSNIRVMSFVNEPPFEKEHEEATKHIIYYLSIYAKLVESSDPDGARRELSSIISMSNSTTEQMPQVSMYSLKQFFKLALIITDNKSFLTKILGGMNTIGKAGIEDSTPNISIDAVDKLLALTKYMHILGKLNLAGLANAELWSLGGLSDYHSLINVREKVEKAHQEIKEAYGEDFLRQGLEKAKEWDVKGLLSYREKIL